jgi:hypothetical protein
MLLKLLKPVGVFVALIALTGCRTLPEDRPTAFSFIVTADVREFTAPRYPGEEYFLGVCNGIQKVGAGDFMLSPGDIDPPAAIRATLDASFGADYPWIPVVGNHEAETPEDMTWLRAWGRGPIPGLVSRGPAGTEETTFSFDYGPAHFVVLNQYFDGKTDYRGKGDVIDPLYEWLKADLENNRNKLLFVVGHEPITPLPDMDNGRMRHEKDCLNAYPENARRFHQLLVEQKVTAYLCAHTHNASVTNMAGVWQIDAGHARGKGDPGAPSTFLKFQVTRSEVHVEFFRDLDKSGAYALTRRIKLSP